MKSYTSPTSARISSPSETPRKLDQKCFFKDETVSFNRDGRIEIQGQRVGDTLYHLNIRAEEIPQSEVLTSRVTQSLSIWHQRFAHLNVKTLRNMIEQRSVEGFGYIYNDWSTTPCEGCLLGKMHRHPFKTGRTRANEIGQLVHADVCGPMQISTPAGSSYFVVFKDDLSGWCTTRLMKQKS